MGPGIRVGPQKLRVVVGLHVNEVGVLEFRGDAVPFTEIRSGYDLLLSPVLPDGDLESEGVADSVVGHAEGVNEEVADLKWAFVIRPDLQVQERRFPKVPAGEISGFPHGRRTPGSGSPPGPGERSSECGRCAMWEITAPSIPKSVSAQGAPAGPHGGEAGVDEQGGPACFQEERVPRTAAAERLKGYGQSRTLTTNGDRLKIKRQRAKIKNRKCFA